MDKVNVNASQAATTQRSDDSASKTTQPKTEFSKVLAQKNADTQTNQAQQNVARGAVENAAKGSAQAQAHAAAQSAVQRGAKGAQMAAAAQQGKMGMGNQMASRPMTPNPHLAKVQQAAKKFDQQLTKAQQSDVQTKATLGDIRTEAKATDMLRSTDRGADVAKAEVRGEVFRGEQIERGAAARAKGEAQQLAHAQLDKARSHQKQALQAGIGAIGDAARVGAASKAKEARKTQEIPQELLDKLVEEVRVGVNEVGHSEFQLDLKEGVLQGMTLRISADGGNVTCRFVGGNAQAKNFIEASEGSLARALESKGLQLAKLEVTSA